MPKQMRTRIVIDRMMPIITEKKMMVHKKTMIRGLEMMVQMISMTMTAMRGRVESTISFPSPGIM